MDPKAHTGTADRPTSGVIVAVRGSVVDARFDGGLPPIYTVLRAGSGNEVVIEVLAQPDEHHVRGIALTPTQGLARGMPVLDTGGPLNAPVGEAILSRMFDVFGETIDRGPALSAVWPGDQPSRRSLRPGSRLSTFLSRWSGAAKRGFSAGPASARPCCSPR
jgi:flagellar biosynthesis/type III secretory pathway ATPase